MGRKDHRCAQCYCTIQRGNSSLRVAGRSDDFYSFRVHIECEAAAQAFWNEFRERGDDWPWFRDGDFEHDDREWIREKFPVVAARLGWCATCAGTCQVDNRLGGISTSGVSPCPDCTP
jgi:hypothetical protein